MSCFLAFWAERSYILRYEMQGKIRLLYIYLYLFMLMESNTWLLIAYIWSCFYNKYNKKKCLVYNKAFCYLYNFIISGNVLLQSTWPHTQVSSKEEGSIIFECMIRQWCGFLFFFLSGKNPSPKIWQVLGEVHKAKAPLGREVIFWASQSVFSGQAEDGKEELGCP